MATLYVTEPGLQVHKIGQRIVLRREGEIVQDIPLIKVDRVVLMGRGVGITTPALYALTRQNIDVVYLTSHGAFISRINGKGHNNTRLRYQQALAVADPAKALVVARAVVRGKIHNQRIFMQRALVGQSWAERSLTAMESAARRLDSAATLDELRGLEGTAAREYFSLMRQALRPPADGPTWGFETRAYYPPPDPINAVLSFGYTLLLNQVIAACQIGGLDPALGFFHSVDFGKPSMALDLEEGFRALLVDSVVLTAANRGLLRLQDFALQQSAPRGGEDEEEEVGESRPRIMLKNDARQKFITLFENRLNETVIYPSLSEETTYRRVLELQVYQMAQMILGEAPAFIPFMLR